MTIRNNTIEKIKVILLVGGRDFGRCRLASRLNRALWPVLGKPALQRLIEKLAHQGIQQIVVCCESPAHEIKASLELPAELKVRFIEETFPRGPAGSIRDAIEPDQDKQILVLPACTVMLPDIEMMAVLHTQSQAEVTIFGVSENSETFSKNHAQIYMCQTSVLDHIPEKGYFDIKEGLIPALVKAGKVVYGTDPPSPVVSYTDWREYMFALRGLLIDRSSFKLDEEYSNWNNNDDVWVGSNVQISPTVKIVGPAVIGNSSMIADNTVLFGPLVIGSNVSIGSGSVVDESILWDRSVVGSKCRIRNSLVDYGRAIPNREVVAGRLVSTPETLIQKTKNAFHQRIVKAQIKHPLPGKRMNEKSLALSDAFLEAKTCIMGLFLSILVVVALIFTYWNPVLKDIWRIWIQSDEYSSGLLVPVIAIYILWLRRESFLKSQVYPNLWGLIILVAVQCFRYWSLYYMFDSGERLSFVLSIGALVFFLLC